MSEGPFQEAADFLPLAVKLQEAQMVQITPGAGQMLRNAS